MVQPIKSVYNINMATLLEESKTDAMRQSITIPAPLAAKVRRVARERHLTVSRAIVTLAERGLRAEEEARENLKTACQRFLKEQEPAKKEGLLSGLFGRKK